MTTRITEIWVGIFIAAGIAALLMLAMKVSNLSALTDDDGFTVEARFEDISGLKVRSSVTMAGVRIGRVSSISFDKKTFEAIVSMRIENQYNTLPTDTSASIYTAGLLGEKYIGLEPGGGSSNCDDIVMDESGEIVIAEGKAENECKEDVLAQGSRIKLTQDSLVLEKLIGQFVSRFLSESDAEEKN